MAANQNQIYVICYDISNSKRLQRLFRFLSKKALHIQYSVFTIQTTPVKINKLMLKIDEYIDKREDDVRIYTVSNRMESYMMGTTALTNVFIERGHKLLEDLRGAGQL